MGYTGLRNGGFEKLASYSRAHIMLMNMRAKMEWGNILFYSHPGPCTLPTLLSKKNMEKS